MTRPGKQGAATALAGAVLAVALAGCAAARSTAAAPSPDARACGVIAAATAGGPIHVDAAFTSSVERYAVPGTALYTDFTAWASDTEDLYAVPAGNPDTAAVDNATIASIGQAITADKKAVTADCASAGVALHLGN
jgi:hypothetical protein